MHSAIVQQLVVVLVVEREQFLRHDMSGRVCRRTYVRSALRLLNDPRLHAIQESIRKRGQAWFSRKSKRRQAASNAERRSAER
jgi:hypothetical protein